MPNAFQTGASCARVPSRKSMRPRIAWSSRNVFARSGVSLTGSTETPTTRTSWPSRSSAPRMLRTCAGQTSLQVEYTNAKTAVCPRRDAALTARPSWLCSVKSGMWAPGGRIAPCQPVATDSPPACASHTPNTPAAAQMTSVVSASATRVGTRRSLGFGEAPPDRVAHELDAVAHAELAQQVGLVRLDGLLGQVQDLGDLLVGVRLGDQLQDLLLARGERLLRPGRGVGHPLADQRALDGVGQERVAAVDGADRVQQRLVDLALEHVAGRAGLQRVEHVALVVVHRQREHLRVGHVRADLARALQAGHARHRHVEHAQVRARGERLLEGLDAVGGLGDDLHVGLAFDQQLQAAAHDAVIVGDEDPHVAPMVSSMVVPSPGSEKMVRWPPTSSARSRMPETPSRARPLEEVLKP